MNMAATETLALEGIAGFAANLTNPFLLLLVVTAAIVLPRDGHVRLAAAALGCIAGTIELLLAAQPHNFIVIILSATLAGLLQGELMLHVVLPACRLAMRIFLHAMSILQRLLRANVE